jgi:hypothetical protein
VVVIIASAWEGLGRINWFVMPALVASTIYLLTVPVKGRQLLRYFLPPFTWCLVGAAASFLVYGIFLQVNGYISPIFDPGMQYHYLSFKLWSNAGFDLGLIPGMLILSLPVGILILWALWKWMKLKTIHWARWLALVGIFFILFVGSTLVSLRVGGGYDLHNYDTFILILFLVGLYFGLQSVVQDEDSLSVVRPWLGKPLLLAAFLLVPVYFAFRDLPVHVVRDESSAFNTITEINTILQNPARQPGPLLFIDQRQLLVYGQVSRQDIFVPYEKIELMEMAMANNLPYLDQFRQDIREQKFAFIISEALTIWPQDGRAPYGYENNVYIQYISLPILEYYLPVYSNKEVGVAIYTPNPDIEETK